MEEKNLKKERKIKYVWNNLTCETTFKKNGVVLWLAVVAVEQNVCVHKPGLIY